MSIDVGVGLWTFQSTSSHPQRVAQLYRDFPQVARRVEELGYADLWLGEHRFWYDAWCPAPLLPLAAAAATTTRLGLGTAMMLLPQHDPARLREAASFVDAVADGRLQAGVGLGHRDAEYDGLGLRRDQRGKRMEAGLDALVADDDGLRPTSVWVGGMAPAALRRLGRRGLSALMPQTLDTETTRRAIDTIREAADQAGVAPGRIGMLKDVWVDGDGSRARSWFLPRLRRHYLEEAGAWWVMKGDTHGFGRPDDLDRQVDRVVDAAVVGSPDEVGESLGRLADDGVDHLVVRLNFDFTEGPALETALELFASTVLAPLREVAA